ncbi:MAG: winged helix-turn-helix transcriptional regulator [Methanomassiliicoccales archaeon]|nr:MAG: winged helix-turn-helix transcriptional regulator [Methanomassiliicoccales archaeon]
MPKKMGEALKTVVGEGYEGEEEKKGRVESVLMNPNREQIFQFLIFHPCSHMRKVANELNMSPPTVKWHLEKLRTGGYVNSALIKNKKVFYPRRMVAEGEAVSLLEAVNRDRIGMTFLVILENQGSTQSEIAEILGLSTQSVRGYIATLERVELITTIVDGKHKRYFPSDKLKKMEKSMRKRIRTFRRFLIKKLEKDRLNPSIDLSRRREAEITIHVSKRKSKIRIPDEPFTSSVISMIGGE